MTVQELIDKLSLMDRDARVVFLEVDREYPSMDSFTIDEVGSQYGFVTLVSVD